MTMCRPDLLSAGESDLTTVGHLLRFVFLSNFTGLPAIAVPVGRNREGKPILPYLRDCWILCKMNTISVAPRHAIYDTYSQPVDKSSALQQLHFFGPCAHLQVEVCQKS